MIIPDIPIAERSHMGASRLEDLSIDLLYHSKPVISIVIDSGTYEYHCIKLGPDMFFHANVEREDNGSITVYGFKFGPHT